MSVLAHKTTVSRTMGCAASATTKLTSVMPIDSKETVKYETREEQAEVEMKDTFVVPQVPEKEVLFELSDEHQIDFDDSELELCQSFEWPKEGRPCDVPLPPGRLEHEKHLCRLEKFMRAARKHPDGFKQYVGRRSSCSSGSSADENFLD